MLDHNDSCFFLYSSYILFTSSCFTGLDRLFSTRLSRNDARDYPNLNSDFKGDTFKIMPVTIKFIIGFFLFCLVLFCDALFQNKNVCLKTKKAKSFIFCCFLIIRCLTFLNFLR